MDSINSHSHIEKNQTPPPFHRTNLFYPSKQWLFLPPFFLFFFAFVLLSSGSYSLPLIDRDEPRFAEAARGMLQKKDFIVPFFNGEFRLDKPPLIYWLMAFFYQLFGVNEFSARLPSILSASILATILYSISNGYCSPIRWVAPIGFIVSVQTLIHGRLATADMVLVLFGTLSQWAFLNLLKKKSPLWFFIFWISLALGFLAKGPIIWFIALITYLLHRFVFWRKALPIANIAPIPGSLLCLAIVSCWAIPALIETKGLFFKIGIGEHIIHRGIEAFDNRPFIPFYYFLSSLVSLYPNSAFFVFFFETLKKNWSMENSFLLSWFLAPILIFSFYATELPHYIMPGFPAYFLLIAQGIGEAKHTRFSFLFALFFLGLFTILALSLIFFCLYQGWPQGTSLKDIPILGGLVLLFLSLFGFTLLSCIKNRSISMPFAFIMALLAALLASSFSFLSKDLRFLSLTIRLSAMFKNMPATSINCAWGYTEPSLVFYSNRNWRWDTALPTSPKPPFFLIQLEEETSLGKGLMQSFEKTKQPQKKQEKAIASPPLSLPSALKNQDNLGEGKIEGLNLGRMSWSKIFYHYHY